MRKILITGISGVGKSTVINTLKNMGYRAIDLDSPAWSVWSADIITSEEYGSPVHENEDWIWNELKVEQLLSRNKSQSLIVSGTAENMGKFRNYFDLVILLSASKAVIKDRLKTRTTNIYGKKEEELNRILLQKDTIEPLLRQFSDNELNTENPLEVTLIQIERMINSVAGKK